MRYSDFRRNCFSSLEMESEDFKLAKLLLEVSNKCNHRKGNEDSYACPSFIDYLDRPLTLKDIPMQSSIEGERLIRRDPSDTPWEDCIKNYIADLASLDGLGNFDAVVLLCAPGYKFARAASLALSKGYVKSSGVLVEVVPQPESKEKLTISVIMSLEVQCSWEVDASSLASELSVWSDTGKYITLCHDYSRDDYRDVLYMLSEGFWSISCTPRNFIRMDNNNSLSNYVCPVFACDGSLETRVVGKGTFNKHTDEPPGWYKGRLGFYLKCIRGSTHSSGRCYDCEMVHRAVVKHYPMEEKRAQPEEVFFVSELCTV